MFLVFFQLHLKTRATTQPDLDAPTLSLSASLRGGQYRPFSTEISLVQPQLIGIEALPTILTFYLLILKR